MKSDLENISLESVFNLDGTNYLTFRKNLKPSYKKTFFDVAKGYFFLALIFFVSLLLIKSGLRIAIAAFPVCALLIGYNLAYLHLFIHAGAHYNLHPNKQKNDRISDYFIGVFFGIRQKDYRKTHWMHHANLGMKNDSEHSYFNELNTIFLLKCMLGIHTISVFLSRQKDISRSDKSGFTLFFNMYVILFHGLLLTILFFLGGWKLLLIWLAGLLIVFPTLAAIRQLLEHRDFEASGTTNYQETDHGKVSRLFGGGFIDNSFGAAGFNRHLLHHWDPTVPYTSLSKIEDFLLNCPETSNIIKENKTSYLKTFLALFKF